VSLVIGLAAAGCKVKEDQLTSNTPVTTTVPGVTITAPTPASPSSGSEVRDDRPTLTVNNATVSDGSAPTYSFQVSIDSTFSVIAAQTSGVPQNPSGQTSWRVDLVLQNRQYFWRARARTASADGPYSSVSDFRVNSTSASGGQPPASTLVTDPLTNGRTVGRASGGRFISQGWQVTARTDYLRYEVPSISSGFVEWENTGLRTTNAAPNNHMLFGMWDPSAGVYRDNAYRVHLQKLDTNHNPPYLRLRWIANGEEHDEGVNINIWEPGTVYSWRIEWGPSADGNTARVFLNGDAVILAGYGRTYRPNTHWIELGIAERAESVVGAVYANVRIGRR
jgi:hypothetical protein